MKHTRNTTGIRAWLVTWEHHGNHAKPSERVAAIYNPRWSPRKVRELVELIYVQKCYTLSERAAYAKNRSFNPYPATFGQLSGVTFQGEIHCGHNPRLYARLVENLYIKPGPDGQEELFVGSKSVSRR